MIRLIDDRDNWIYTSCRSLVGLSTRLVLSEERKCDNVNVRYDQFREMSAIP